MRDEVLELFVHAESDEEKVLMERVLYFHSLNVIRKHFSLSFVLSRDDTLEGDACATAI
jgi:hypothetical protein